MVRVIKRHNCKIKYSKWIVGPKISNPSSSKVIILSMLPMVPKYYQLKSAIRGSFSIRSRLHRVLSWATCLSKRTSSWSRKTELSKLSRHPQPAQRWGTKAANNLRVSLISTSRLQQPPTIVRASCSPLPTEAMAWKISKQSQPHPPITSYNKMLPIDKAMLSATFSSRRSGASHRTKGVARA